MVQLHCSFQQENSVAETTNKETSAVNLSLEEMRRETKDLARRYEVIRGRL